MKLNRMLVLALTLLASCVPGKSSEGDAGMADADAAVPDAGESVVCHPADGETCTSNCWCLPAFRPESPRVTALHARAEDDVWAGGSAGEIWHFDGILLRSVPAPGTSAVQAVFATAAGTWAALADGQLAYLQSGKWTTTKPAFPVKVLWGGDAADMWAGGKGLLHFDGKAWTEVAFPADVTGEVSGLWGTRSDEVWAVGSLRQAGTAVALHWDGQRWSAFSTGSASDLFGIWGSAPDTYFATAPGAPAGAGLLRWNGTGWAPVADLMETGLKSISGLSAKELYLARGGIIVSYGGSFTRAEYVGGDLVASAGSHSFVGGQQVFSVFASGQIREGWVNLLNSLRYDSSLSGFASPAPGKLWIGGSKTIWQLEGEKWLPGYLGVIDRPLTLASLSPTNAWAITNSARVLRFNGKRWTNQEGAHLQGVALPGMVVAGQDVWLASVPGGLYRWDESTSSFALAAPMSSEYSSAIAADESGGVWVGTTDGRMLRWTGTRLEKVYEPAPPAASAPVTAIFFADADHGFAVGDGGQILGWEGKSWALIEEVPETHFLSIAGTSPTDMWLGGKSGVLGHFDGKHFQSSNAFAAPGNGSPGPDITEIMMQGPGDGWLVASEKDSVGFQQTASLMRFRP